jgi:hypothetical protein
MLVRRGADAGCLSYRVSSATSAPDEDDYGTPTPSDARSRPPSLILFSLDLTVIARTLLILVGRPSVAAAQRELSEQALSVHSTYGPNQSMKPTLRMWGAIAKPIATATHAPKLNGRT